jgi:hypothetical protein
VAFGPKTFDGQDQEHFFLGAKIPSKSGLIYGRMLTSPSFENDFTLNDELTSGRSSIWAQVTALSSNGVDRLWVATNAGVAEVVLPSLSVTQVYATGSTPGDVPALHVVVADAVLSGAAAFFSTATDLYLIRPSNAVPLHFTGPEISAINGIGAIALDDGGDLWVAERSGLSTLRRIFRYTAADLLTWAQGGSEPTPVIGEFDPSAPGSRYTDPRDITDLSVNSFPVDQEVWVATNQGAFFQRVSPGGALFDPKLCGLGPASGPADWESPFDDEDAAGNSCADPGTGWHPVPQKNSESLEAVRENFGAVLADPVGNVWLGSDSGVRAIIARSLTLSGSRFIGTAARTTVFISDDNFPDQDVTVTVKVGSTSQDFAVPLDSTGQGELTFGYTFSDASDPSVPPHLFPVTSSATGVDIEVSYKVTADFSLTALASWAQIIPFEDDLWIGGPCFLQLLEHR